MIFNVIKILDDPYIGQELDNLGCWAKNTIERVVHPLLFFNDPELTTKQLLQKCYLLSKSLEHHVFALSNGTLCLSSIDAENIYRKNGISSNCQSDGKGGTTAMQVYKIGNQKKLRNTKYVI